jgi:hypothetical protein
MIISTAAGERSRWEREWIGSATDSIEWRDRGNG